MSFQDQIESVNDSVMNAFADECPIIYLPSNPAINSVQVNSIPIDPIRLGEVNPNMFNVRWVRLSDLAAAGIAPVRGDQVIIGDPTGPTGSFLTYTVDQVQNDTGGGVRLILARR